MLRPLKWPVYFLAPATQTTLESGVLLYSQIQLQMMDQKINSVVYVKMLREPMNFLLSVCPSKEMEDGTAGEAKPEKTFISTGHDLLI